MTSEPMTAGNTTPDPMTGAGLVIENLTIGTGVLDTPVVERLSFSVPPGHMTALVGESGSGKTMAARSIMGLLPAPLKVSPASRILFNGKDLSRLSPRDLRRVRGAEIGMIFQEPMVSLNPSMTIGRQIAEGMRLHLSLDDKEIHRRCIEMLERIRIRNPEECLKAWPHQFSGGMRQRIMIASAMLLKPKLLIADEPTTALDTLVSRDVLDLMTELARESGTSVLLISHDLGMVAHYVQDVVVMQSGSAVEAGAASTVLRTPQHAYTRKLVEALPRRGPARAPADPGTPPLLKVSDLSIGYREHGSAFSRGDFRRVVHEVDFEVRPGETLALVGASGSGKTTLGRSLIGLAEPEAGSIVFQGQEIAGKGPAHACPARRNMQMIFQDPYSSLDPRQKIGSILAEPLRHVSGLDAVDRRKRVLETCSEVGLDWALTDRLPHQLSGGQRQRVAIARAIVTRPAFVIADEPVSALDMTIQKQILELIRRLQDHHGFACLFVSHDLGAVEQVADRVAVMEAGHIVELKTRDALFDNPEHPYTKRLLGASLRFEHAA
ncbi:peptide ABC transporter ATP-binding protein (plasmid) [Rhizobium sp. ACO-34A]|nr:ABC transporter ATP-binding protein [Rhizobium sp. ACO-34A]ATN37210.1 peptide ABC transporter ATP-binding protein [Rhizobium sp. ACO-34A]